MKPSLGDKAIIDRFAAYHARNPVWGSLHIALDDGKVADDHVKFCIQWAADQGDDEGVELGKLLLSMSRTQRLKLPYMVR